MSIGGPKKSDDGNGGDELFADINITPLTDIFLVLLIIFMVTSSVMATDGARAGVRVNLPKGATKEIASNTKDVTVAITTDGNMVVDGKPVSADTLRKIFDDAKARDPETQVVVQADEATHHGRVVAVMELAKAAGLRRLAIATRRR
ncbi:MAG TPA: biopolymer transporter ExbD [Polyangia bacterium]|jgi:biopolymer transport protein ExbD|nr:biopolymer transporter ExbD [Polyangia bacterium]